MSTAPIWWGDAVRAATALEADAATRRRILDLLGLAGPLASMPPGDEASVPRRRWASPPAVPSGVVRPADAQVLTAAQARPAPAPEPGRDPSAAPVVERLPPTPAKPPRPFPPLSLPAPPEVVLESTHLLPPGRTRAILTALCSVPGTTSEVDLAALVPLLANRVPLRALPVLPRPTTRRGVQLLVDHGPAMTPFAQDQDDVRAAIARVVGGDALEVVRFSGTPLDPPGAGSGPRWTWQPYRPPTYSVPVLALTDLGALAAPAERTGAEASWLRVSRLMHEAGCPFTALCPVPTHRIAPAVRAAIAVVSWDRTTGVGHATRAARRAGGRRAPRYPS